MPLFKYRFKRQILGGLLGAFLGATASLSNAEYLKIETIREGSGAIAETGLKVEVHYTGKLTDGSVFDSSLTRNQPFSFILGQGQVIKGWEEGILGMRIGEKRLLTIPPELGYGARGAGNAIPPNATLVFEVELLGVRTPPSLGQASVDAFQGAKTKGAIIIDIRREEEWRETGIIDGAHTITAFTNEGKLHRDFQSKFFALVPSPDTPVYLYCRTGNRTTSLGNALVNQVGLSNVTHLSTGIVGWKKAGKSVVPFSE